MIRPPCVNVNCKFPLGNIKEIFKDVWYIFARLFENIAVILQLETSCDSEEHG